MSDDVDPLVEKFAQALSEEVPGLHPSMAHAAARTAAAVARGTLGDHRGRLREPAQPSRPGLSIVRDECAEGDDESPADLIP